MAFDPNAKIRSPKNFATVVKQYDWYEIKDLDDLAFGLIVEQSWDPFLFQRLLNESCGEVRQAEPYNRWRRIRTPQGIYSEQIFGNPSPENHRCGHIHLPVSCLNSCADALFLPARYLQSAGLRHSGPLNFFPSNVAEFGQTILLNPGISQSLKKGMAAFGAYAHRVELFESLLIDEIIPKIPEAAVDKGKAVAVLGKIRNCSKENPFYFDELQPLAEKYLDCKFGMGAESLKELLCSGTCSNEAFLAWVHQKYETNEDALRVNPDRESILKHHAYKSKIRNEPLPPLTEEEIQKEIERIKEQDEKLKQRRKYLLDKYTDWCAKGFGPEWLFIQDVPVIPLQERRGNEPWQNAINQSYIAVIVSCSRIERLKGMHAPQVILNSETRTLQLRVDALLYNLMVVENMKKNGEIKV